MVSDNIEGIGLMEANKNTNARNRVFRITHKILLNRPTIPRSNRSFKSSTVTLDELFTKTPESMQNTRNSYEYANSANRCTCLFSFVTTNARDAYRLMPPFILLTDFVLTPNKTCIGIEHRAAGQKRIRKESSFICILYTLQLRRPTLA